MARRRQEVERLVAGLARRQYSLVTRSQALACGMTPGGIDWLVRRARWEAIHPGVYRPRHSSPSRGQEVLGACLAAGSGALASHRSAAWLWGLLPPAAMVVEVTVPASRLPRLHGVLIHRSRRMEAEPCTLRRIPLTSPVATIVDLAEVLGGPELHSVLDRAARARLAGAADVAAHLGATSRAGSRGVACLRRVLGERGWPGLPTSVLEGRMLELIRRHQLPPPARELPVGPGHRYRADLAYAAARLLIEVDGFDTHGTPESLDADLGRQNQLVSNGWRVLRYSWRAVVHQPSQVAAEIAAQLSMSGHEV